MLIHQGWFTALYTQHLLNSQSLEFEICIFPREAIPLQMYSVLISGSKIFVHSCAATPNYLLDALAKHGKNNNLKDVELIHIPTVGPAVYNNIEYEGMC